MDLLDIVGIKFGRAADGISVIWDALCQLLAPVLEVSLQHVTEVLERALALLTDLLNFFAALFRGDWEVLLDNIIDLAADKLGALAERSFGWGWDLIRNFTGGILDGLPNLRDAVKGAAELVKRFIHFSKPDEGPLADFDTYAPDMMRLFAQGIRDNESLVRGQLRESLPEITVNAPQAQTAAATAGQGAPRNQTIIMQVDRTQFARLVYQLNSDETRRVGVNLAY